MSIESTTLLFELSEILDDLEGVFIDITYEFDTDDILNNDIQINKNLNILNIQGNSLAHSVMTASQLQTEVMNYLQQSNGYYAKTNFLNSEVSPFNTFSFKEHEYKTFVNEYFKHH